MRTDLRLKDEEWFNRETHEFLSGYTVRFPCGVLLLRCIEDDGLQHFEGPRYLVPLLERTDDKKTVLKKLQKWVDENRERVVATITRDYPHHARD